MADTSNNVQKPMPPASLIDEFHAYNRLIPASEIMEWAIQQFISEDGELHRWVDMFHTTRERFQNETADIPIANKAY
jgi:hypothetical protein